MSAKMPVTWLDRDYLQMIHHKVCRDRFHLSEAIYSGILGRPCKIYDMDVLCKALRTHRVWTLVLVADEGLLRSRLQEQCDAYQTAETVLAANQAYFKLDAKYMDQVVYTSPAMPFVSDDAIDTICKRYLAR